MSGGGERRTREQREAVSQRRRRWEEKEQGLKLLEPERKQACTQNDQVFIASFTAAVLKLRTTLSHRTHQGKKERKNVLTTKYFVFDE
jgi:hypothetical protein